MTESAGGHPENRSYPQENPFGVPQSTTTARLRLPSGDRALALAAWSGTGSTGPAQAETVVPGADHLRDVDWVTADCVLWTWPAAGLARLSSVLASAEVKLAFVEPTAGLGVRHRLQLLAEPLIFRRCGHRHHRDVPQELRDAGLTVTTTVRFREGPGHYVWGEARHYRHPVTTR